jgi:hypothetical protein
MTRVFAAWVLSLALIVPSAGAFTPESGFYNLFSADAHGGEGTGLAVEIQNDYLFAAGFVFRPDGSPTFVTIEGELTRGKEGWTLRGDNALYTYSGGQCIGSLARCPYRKSASTSIGDFALVFTAENEGRLEWGAADNRAIVALRRACVGSICYDAPSSLLGEWDVVIDGVPGADGLRFGADRLAIANVAPKGDTRAIEGCIASSEAAPPDCARAHETLEGTARRCAEASCKGYRYRLVVRAIGGIPRGRIVRVYEFTENGHDGGSFGGTIRGHVDLCPKGAREPRACTARKGMPFVAYKSGSIGFVRRGEGTD